MFFWSFAFFFVVRWERALEVVVVACSRKRKVQLCMRAGMRAVVPFCVRIPSLADNLSNKRKWNVNADAGSGSTDRTWK